MYFPTRKAWRAIKHVDDSEMDSIAKVLDGVVNENVI